VHVLCFLFSFSVLCSFSISNSVSSWLRY